MTLTVLALLGSLLQGGTLQGVVVDPHEARIPGVGVLIAGNQFAAEIKTDDKGQFAFQLPTGTYRVEVRTQGFSIRPSPSCGCAV